MLAQRCQVRESSQVWLEGKEQNYLVQNAIVSRFGGPTPGNSIVDREAALPYVVADIGLIEDMVVGDKYFAFLERIMRPTFAFC